MSSLLKLEDAGIQIVTSFLKNFSQLQSATKIVLSKFDKLNWQGEKRSEFECLEVVIHQWENKKGRYSPTWQSLLQVISTEMNLKKLGKRLEDYLTGE